MPFLSISLTAELNNEVKKDIIFEVTKITSDLLQVPPDKIQVLLQKSAKSDVGRAGAALLAPDFPTKSRITDLYTDETYYSKDTYGKEEMVIISIDVWKMYDQSQKNEWTRLLTEYFTDVLDISSDNVLILLKDMPPGNWGQAGYTGADENFLIKTRVVNKSNKRKQELK